MPPAREPEETLFYAASQITDEAERSAFLDRACVGDATLREAVEALLARRAAADAFFAQGRAGLELAPDEHASFIAASGQAAASIEDDPGQILGPYRLVERVGEGGCGVVYRAEQEEPIRRSVALKIIKLGMDTRAVIARFAAERRALALMDHPNIARVLDAGSTPSGRPYFVMEFVKGPLLTAYCDQHRLGLDARLRLFVTVCQAVQHAHQKGIVHRDLKPSNLLVATSPEGVPVPKVIDFGISKAIDSRPGPEESLLTRQGEGPGTPAYMSPEQAAPHGVDIDTRSDLYSLGVVLHELLLGVLPADPDALAQADAAKRHKMLAETPPVRLSLRWAKLDQAERRRLAALRSTAPDRVGSQLRGDLDWILIRCLEPDRERRYASAAGLALEIERHLRNEPISASPPSTFYLLGKLIRRHRVAFAAGGAIACAVCAGLLLSLWLWRRELAARRTQTELRAEAETARAHEARLRGQAVARETITRAAIAVAQGDYQTADDLLNRVSDYSPELSFDSVSAFRAVGEWHALAGRWDAAAAKFTALMAIDQLDGWDVVTLDYQSCSVVLARTGDKARYRDFCAKALKFFAAIDNGDAAGRVLKSLLLLPPDPELLRAMEPLASLCERHWAGHYTLHPTWRPIWDALPLAVWAYRRGDHAECIARCERILSYEPEINSLYAICRVLLGLSQRQLGKTAEAEKNIAAARAVIEAQIAAGLNRSRTTDGFWFDWLFADILLREADSASPRPKA